MHAPKRFRSSRHGARQLRDFYNDESDVDALLECIRQIVAEKK